MRKYGMLPALMLCTTVYAENQFAFLDFVHIERSDKTFMSLDVGPDTANAETVTLTGTLWNQEMSASGPKPTEISIDASVLELVKEEENETIIGDVTFSVTQRSFQVNNQVVLRKLLISEDNATIMSVSDDPGPLALAAAVAGAAVVICTTKIVYDMLQCPEGSKMKVSFSLTAGITCESECK